MPFRRNQQALRLRPVESIKHVVDTNGGVTGGTASITDVIVAAEAPVSSTPNQCKITSTVRAIYLRVEVIQKVAAGGVDNIYMYVAKNPSNDIILPFVDAVGASDKRKWVIHQEMMMTGNVLTAADAIPRTLFKGVIKIPFRYQRIGIQDKLEVHIGHRNGEVTQQSNFCLQCIYREFR